MMLLIVAYASRCDSNLIFLAQLKEAGILYYDHLGGMILKKAGNISDSALQKKISLSWL